MYPVSKNAIAILPFVNMSPDRDNEYFSDGVTEEIINALANYSELHVTARTSSFAFKNQTVDIREIGSKLGVYYILEGSVRRSGDVVRITAQLIKTDDGFHVWSETWDRELKNIFALQDEIARLIAEKINSKILPQKAVSEHTIINPKALDLYMKGQYMLNNFDIHNHAQMIASFEEAIALEPSFDKPYVGLCGAYTWLSSVGIFNPMEGNAKVQENLKKLLKINPDTPEIYTVIAGKNYWIDWDMASALQNCNRAIELRPNNAEAFVMKGMTLMSLGRTEEAFDAFFQAQRLNPYDELTDYCVGFLYSLLNENEKAIEVISQSINTLSLWHAHYFLRVETLCKLGRFAEAWEVIAEKEAMEPFRGVSPYIKGLYYSLEGKPELAKAEIEAVSKKLSGQPQLGMPYYYYLSKIFINLDEFETALFHFERGVQSRATPLLFANIDCAFDAIRNEPRFEKALKSLNLVAPNLSPEKEKYKRTNFTKQQISDIARKLTQLMETEKPYLNPRLSLPDLAEMVDITTNQLSQYLNENEKKNFYDYVNTFRLNEFRTLCGNKKYAHLTILGLAYECGFNSKTTFNAFFKREMGVTPSVYFKEKTM